MTRLTPVLFAVAAAVPVAADPDLSWDQLPPPVQLAVATNIPDPVHSGFGDVSAEGQAIYEATHTYEGRRQSLEVAADGTVLKREQRVTVWEMPGDILLAIERTWPGAVLDEVEFNREGDQFSYEIEMTAGGVPREVEITTSGEVLVDRGGGGE